MPKVLKLIKFFKFSSPFSKRNSERPEPSVCNSNSNTSSHDLLPTLDSTSRELSVARDASTATPNTTSAHNADSYQNSSNSLVNQSTYSNQGLIVSQNSLSAENTIDSPVLSTSQITPTSTRSAAALNILPSRNTLASQGSYTSQNSPNSPSSSTTPGISPTQNPSASQASSISQGTLNSSSSSTRPSSTPTQNASASQASSISQGTPNSPSSSTTPGTSSIQNASASQASSTSQGTPNSPSSSTTPGISSTQNASASQASSISQGTPNSPSSSTRPSSTSTQNASASQASSISQGTPNSPSSSTTPGTSSIQNASASQASSTSQGTPNSPSSSTTPGTSSTQNASASQTSSTSQGTPNSPSSSTTPSTSPTHDAIIPHLPDLTEDDKYRLFNKKACDSVLPDELKRIITWGCRKDQAETFWEYIQKMYAHEWAKYKKMWKNYEITKLCQTDCDGYDITVLQKLIPEVCENIERMGTAIWMSGDETRIECVLKKLKDLRNDVMHEPDKAAISPYTLKEIERLLVKLIEVAGVLYCIAQTECSLITHEITENFKKIKQMFHIKKELILEKVQLKLKTEGVQEMKTHWELHYDKINLPASNNTVRIKDVFHTNQLEICNDNGQIERGIACTDIIPDWARPGQEIKTFIVEGAAGAGKSTILRAMALDFFHGAQDKRFQRLENFSMLLYISGREYNILTFSDLIQKTFPKTIEGIDPQYIEPAIMGLKTLIFIDGIDELKEESRKFIHNLMIKYKTNDLATIIATSRPFATDDFKKFLQQEGIPCSTARIREMKTPEEQRQFLSRYALALPNVQETKIWNAFMKHPTVIRNQLFIHPVQLVLHYQLCEHSEKNVENLTSEAAIMRQMIDLYKTRMHERLKQQDFGLSETEIIFQTLYQTSLQCLQNDRFYLTEEDCGKFHKEVISKLKKHVSGSLMLSCILVAECYGLHGATTFAYFHKSQQEYFAAKAIIANFNENSSESLYHSLSKALGQTGFVKNTFFK